VDNKSKILIAGALLSAAVVFAMLVQSGSLSPEFLRYGHYHIPNFLLAALMYTALGRFILTFIFDEHSTNFIWRFFIHLTDPLIRLIGYVTPRAVPSLFLLLFAVIWLFAARVALYLIFALAGLAPTPGVTS
jgi:hypothetical protein